MIVTDDQKKSVLNALRSGVTVNEVCEVEQLTRDIVFGIVREHQEHLTKRIICKGTCNQELAYNDAIDGYCIFCYPSNIPSTYLDGV